MKKITTLLMLLVCTALSYGQFMLVDSAKVTRADVRDTTVGGVGQYRFAMNTAFTTFTRYAQFEKAYGTTTVPTGHMLVTMRAPNISGQLRVAVRMYENENVLANSQLAYISPNTDSTYRFYFPLTSGTFNRFRIVFSYIEGETGERTVFLGNVTLVSGTDTTVLDSGPNAIVRDTVPPLPPANFTVRIASSSVVVAAFTAPDAIDLDSVGVELAPDSTFDGATKRIVKKVAHGVRDSVTFSGLTAERHYFVRAFATDTAGNVARTGFVQILTPPLPDGTPPDQPSIFSISLLSGQKVEIVIANPFDDDLKNITVEVATDFNFVTNVKIGMGNVTVPGGLNAVVFDSLLRNQTYYVRAYATDTAGNRSEFSLIDNFSTSGPDGVGEMDAPQVFALHNAYPNPFNPTTTIAFDLPEATEVTCAVYSILGETVAILATGELWNAGTHELRFDGATVPSGVYFYRFSTPRFSAVGKMVLAK